jgi:uncharacterized membrane protein YhhN
MKPHTRLALAAILIAIIEILTWQPLGYEYPIPIIGFILGIFAAMWTASYKSRPHKED